MHAELESIDVADDPDRAEQTGNLLPQRVLVVREG